MSGSQAIGIFDSGLGGLTVVRRLSQLLPNENIVYFGDTGRVPYGTRSTQTIRKYAAQDIRFLLSKGVKLIIAACGTVSSVCDDLESELPVPFASVVNPAATAAVRATRNSRIGIIGTSATIRSSSYRLRIQQLSSEIQVCEQACPLFVPLVENGFVSPNDLIAELTAQRYLQPLIEANVDTLILGCTHYPILADTIQKVMGDKVTLINAGDEAANYAAALMKDKNMLAPPDTVGDCKYYVSDTVEGFAGVAGMFLGRKIDHDVETVDVEELGQ